ncbi:MULTISPECIES: hypothetical protein [unclassified Rhodococcus (in: high G+C Gram-positive bacteria)]|uniref:hypothetical protein n=1 Tax=unclassified Rhodococcus (in: high G+C Gram-positive bacteria) TaxID=192944 RepID=UPI001639FF7E|nr:MULTISPECIES: hypothetical protein [unclassified Rhodococcus (in: high G+C Gram-positive bacteria)]MBC2638575.1 hypothetical protein [Rhodococcus sp. 3A]MBC2896684.1 hypothetical protein [Rhodococcus sp. 4CII]
MNDDHAQLIAELRALADTALDRLEPILQRAAAPHAQAEAAGAPPGTGQWSGCTWCPVCALAALIRGEQHDLVTLVAGQASVLIAVLRQILDEHRVHGAPGPGGPESPEPGPEGGGGTSGPDGGSAFEPITVTFKR